MTIMWPYLGIKTGGIKRGELVVIGAFSKKEKCMYQIQVRKHGSEVWENYGRPWYMEHNAVEEANEKFNQQTGVPEYEFQIVEV